jgi:hypothetical protein
VLVTKEVQVEVTQRWVAVIQADSEARSSFNQWIEDTILGLTVAAVMNANDMQQVLGVRFAIGELEKWRTMINWEEQEGERIHDGIVQ